MHWNARQTLRDQASDLLRPSQRAVMDPVEANVTQPLPEQPGLLATQFTDPDRRILVRGL